MLAQSSDSPHCVEVAAHIDTNAPRITQQYRDRERRMVYELRCGTSALVVLATQSSENTDEWRFEAHPMEAPERIVKGEGSTRAAAFGAMRDMWIERGEALGLASVEWEKVATALTSVRAI